MTTKEILEKALAEEAENLVRLEINLEFYNKLSAANKKDEGLIKSEAKHKILVSRQELMVSIIKGRLEKV